MCLIGTIHFLWGGLVGFEGWGVSKKTAFKFSGDSICNNANVSARMPKISISKALKVKISQVSMPPDPPTLL